MNGPPSNRCCQAARRVNDRRARNLVERFFNKIKQCRRIATRYDKRAANYLAFIKLAAIIWLRACPRPGSRKHRERSGKVIQVNLLRSNRRANLVCSVLAVAFQPVTTVLNSPHRRTK